MITLEDIKDEYYLALSSGSEYRGFDEYLNDEYVQTYDNELNFIGWSKS